MIKVLFICHGNICRSPMAEFVMKDLVEAAGMKDAFHIASAATSTEEIGNPVHPGTRNLLATKGISTKGKVAVQVTKKDYDTYDYLVVMDQNNMRNLMRIIGNDTENKVSKLLDYTPRPGDIADPWYTGNFTKTYEEVLAGCNGLLEKIINA